MNSGVGGRLLAVMAAVALLVGIVTVFSADRTRSFDVDSAAPDGWKALSDLLVDRGVLVRTAAASELARGEAGIDLDGDLDGEGRAAVVVAVSTVATDQEIQQLEQLARSGVVVIFGEDPDAGDSAATALDEAIYIDDRSLADSPASETAPGECDISELDGLGDIDTEFVVPVQVESGAPRCYSESGTGTAHVTRREESGAFVIASPYLWVNARLQPRKEYGDPPQDNAAVAVRLLGDVDTVTFIDPVPSAGQALDGSSGPLSMMPLPVKLALAQLVGALFLLIWWRSRRLGPPVSEQLPVEIAGSELVAAVGDLLRRRGNPARAAEAVRGDTRRQLAHRLGLGPEPNPRTLVEVVAARTGRAPDEVGTALYGHPSKPLDSASALVDLVATLESIRKEVLDVALR